MSGNGPPMVEYGDMRISIVMARNWRRIEQEYGEPIADVILGFRSDRLTWKTIAAIFEVCEWTLLNWRKVLGLPINMHDHVKYSDKQRRPSDEEAKRLGYPNIVEAIRDLRLAGLTMELTAERLNVHKATVNAHTPPEMRGLINLKPGRREYLRWHARRYLGKKPAHDHPWRMDWA